MSTDLSERYGVLIDAVMLALSAGLVEDIEATQKALESFTGFVYSDNYPFHLDWSGVDEGTDWFAIDKDGHAYFYTEEPQLNLPGEEWSVSELGSAHRNSSAIQFKGWETSKVRRP